MKYQRESRMIEVVEAEQFDPEKKPWPKAMHPWPDPVYGQPRDMSFGYVLTFARRVVHVQAGDWIVTFRDGSHTAVAQDYFQRDWKPVEVAS